MADEKLNPGTSEFLVEAHALVRSATRVKALVGGVLQRGIFVLDPGLFFLADTGMSYPIASVDDFKILSSEELKAEKRKRIKNLFFRRLF